MHLSDLHFGRDDPLLVEAAVEDVRRLEPHVVAVSGDLTQRARASEYAAARDFLRRLPRPQVVVPGNHDIALFDPLRRFLWPLRRWKRFVTPDLAPVHQDGEIAVAGISTARSFTWKNGRVSHEQMELLRDRLCGMDEEVFKVLVTHHPFLPPLHRERAAVVGRAEETLRVLRECGLDMILSGHYHMSAASSTHRLYRVLEHSVLVVQAGTATSVRTRAERNSYNVVTVEGQVVDVAVRLWDGERFVGRESKGYGRIDGLWTPLSEPARREVAAAESGSAR